MSKKLWWSFDKWKVHEELHGLVRRLRDNLKHEVTHPRFFEDLFNRTLPNIRPGYFPPPPPLKNSHGEKDIVLGILLNIAQTLSSKICAHRPKPNFLTVMGDWELKQTAKKLERYVMATFQQARMNDHATAAFFDAIWTGTGFIKVYPAFNQVKLERVLPVEILVDEAGCMASRPRSLYQHRYMPAEVLKAMFPERQADIERIALETYIAEGRVQATNLVEVIEAWHLPSGPDSKDGRHCIAIETATMIDEVWEYDYFPFAEVRWTTLPVGFYGQGVVEQQRSIQLEANKLAQRVQKSMHLFANAVVTAEEGSLTHKSGVSNQLGVIVEHKPGTQPPQVVTPASMNNQVYQHLDWLNAKPYEYSGVSQFAATATKPPGDLSGVALRTLQDVESQRQGLPGRNWEQLWVDTARLVVRTSQKMYQRSDTKTNYQVKYAEADYYESIKWSDVDLDEKAYVLQVWPVSLLPDTPAGRLAMVQEFISSGFMDAENAMALLDFPDVKKYQAYRTAALDIADQIIERLLADGYEEADVPKEFDFDPMLPYDVIMERMKLASCRARLDGAPKDRVEALSTWMAQAQKYLDGQMAVIEAQAMAQAPPEAVPETAPGVMGPSMMDMPPTGGIPEGVA